MSRQGCSEFRRTLQHPDRRSFVKAGVLGTMGLSLSDLLRSDARASASASLSSRKNSVIILWMRGGPSHIDMWDPKPDAPEDYRGEFKTIRSSVPGINLTDLLPMSAKMMHKWSMIRSLNHHDAGHSTGDQICFTGYNSGPTPDENVHPSCGSIVSKQLGHLSPTLPAYVMIPRMVPGTGSAYLGVTHKPFETQADPAKPGPFQLPNFSLPEGVTVERVGDRKGLLRSFDAIRRDVDQTGQLDAVDRYQQKAWDIVTSQAARDAFDLDKEPQGVRERYGIMPAFDPGATNRCGCPAWSQRILLARRLVEAGVRLVTVDLRWWDTHVKGFESLRLGFLDRWDRVYTALIEDLESRGLLESTLVLAWGEFGRTPKVNNDAGRDHYPGVFSAALAGGGVKGGRAIGESDEKAPSPKPIPSLLRTCWRRSIGTSASTPTPSTSTMAGRSPCCPSASRSTNSSIERSSNSSSDRGGQGLIRRTARRPFDRPQSLRTPDHLLPNGKLDPSPTIVETILMTAILRLSLLVGCAVGSWGVGRLVAFPAPKVKPALKCEMQWTGKAEATIGDMRITADAPDAAIVTITNVSDADVDIGSSWGPEGHLDLSVRDPAGIVVKTEPRVSHLALQSFDPKPYILKPGEVYRCGVGLLNTVPEDKLAAGTYKVKAVYALENKRYTSDEIHVEWPFKMKP